VFHKEAFPRKVSPFPQNFTVNGLKANPYLAYLDYDDPLFLFAVRDPARMTGIPPASIEDISTGFGYLAEAERFASPGNAAVVDAPECSFGKALHFPAGTAGTAFHELFFPAGIYEGHLTVRANAPQPGLPVFLRFADRRGERTLLAPPFPALAGGKTGTTARLPFRLVIDRTDKVRFILETGPRGDVTVDCLELRFENRPQPEKRLTFRDGIFTGRIVRDSDAAPVILVDEKEYGRGPAFFGPNRYYPSGSYRALFVMKGAFPASKDPAVHLGITGPHGIRTIAETPLFAKDFDAGAFRVFPLSFELKRGGVINFLAGYRGKGRLWLRTVRVERPDAPFSGAAARK
jgi:hypothetical protein